MKKAFKIIGITAIFAVVLMILGIAINNRRVKAEKHSATITVTDVEGRNVTIKRNVKRIVVLNASSLSILYGLNGKAVGRTDTSIALNSEMKKVPSVGSVSKPDYEKIAELKPDVVFGNMKDEKTINTLKQFNIPVVFTRMESYEDTIKVIKLIGKVTNSESKANSEVSRIEKYKDKLTAKVKAKPNGLKTLIIMGSAKSLNAALPNSFEGDILKMSGGKNIISQTQSKLSDVHYIPLSMETVIKENPDLILVSSHGTPDQLKKIMQDEIADNPAWNNINAVRNNKIVYLPYDIFTVRPGLNITKTMDFMIKTLDKQ